MSDADDWDRDWWKKERDASLERQEAEAPSASGVQAGDTFLLVTEGTVSEPIYFELFLAALELLRVSVWVLPGETSDPRRVIETAFKLAKARERKARKEELGMAEVSKFDHVWAIVDTDVAVRDGLWDEVQQLATARGVKLAHSTPCFEFWLLLHHGYTTRGDLLNGATAKSALEQKLGRKYDTNAKIAREVIASFVGKWLEAVNHAERVRQHHLACGSRPPANPSTEVDELVRAINNSAPEHLRKR